MRRLIHYTLYGLLAIGLISCLNSLSHAQEMHAGLSKPFQAMIGMIPATGGGGACTYTLRDKQEGTNDNFLSGITAYLESGTPFVKSSTQTIKKVSVFLSRTGTDFTGRILSLKLCDDDGASPGRPTNCTTFDNTITKTDLEAISLDTTFSWIDFTSATGKSLTDTYRYHIVQSWNSTNGSNYLHWKEGTASGITTEKTTDGTTWTNVDTNLQGNFRLYTCD